jgi:5'-nucleotidase
MRIVITNDDGVEAPGIAVLTRAVSRWIKDAPAGEERTAAVVAPMTNMSGMSAAVTDIYEHPDVPYRRHAIDGVDNIPIFAIDGPPALCVILAALGTFGERPNFVLSGINAGANVGRSILHSGTIGAILTGGQMGLSGLAVSVQWGPDVHFDAAGDVAIEVLDQLRDAPRRTLLNLNVPNLPVSELLGVRRGRVSGAGLVKSARPTVDDEWRGTEGTLHINFGPATPELGDVSDEDADEDGALLVAGYASLTPLRGPHEDTDPGFNDIMHAALRAIERHLG